MTSLRVLVAMALTSHLVLSGHAASFQLLGILPGGSTSYAYGVSADGEVAVGGSARLPMRWTSADGMVELEGFPNQPIGGVALGISNDKSTIVGSSYTRVGELTDQACSWNIDGDIAAVSGTADAYIRSQAYGVSADGSVIVGTGWPSLAEREAFRWTKEGGLERLGDFPSGSFNSYAFDVTADGAIVVGVGQSDLGLEAFRWTREEGMLSLGDLPGGDHFSEAQAISSDGATIVGRSSSIVRREEAFRWTAEEGMVGLGYLPGGESSSATAVSADGSIIVGRPAFLWHQDYGMLSVRSLLINQGIDLQGLDYMEVEDVSADGRTIVGWGYDQNLHQRAWIATIEVHELPEPSSLWLVACSALCTLAYLGWYRLLRLAHIFLADRLQ